MKKCYLLIFSLFLYINVFAQPANDNCADAIAIGEVGNETFSTIDATTDGMIGPNHIASCPGNANTEIDSIYNDIWYAYTPTFTGDALWSLCGQTAFDTKIAVYNPGSACPPTDADLLDCNEDGTGQFCSDAFESDLLFPVTMGETYLLRIGGFGDIPDGETAPVGATGEGGFSIEQFIPSVPNDLCSAAIELSNGEGIEFDNLGATTDGPSHETGPCFGFNDLTIQADIWYTFTAPENGSILWATCDMAFFDTRLAVYGPNASCPPLPEELYECNDDGSGCADYSSSLFFEVEAGNTYLLRLGGFDGATGDGAFDFIYEAAPEPPANDLCENAETVTIQAPGGAGETQGDNSNGSFDFNNFSFPYCLTNTNGGEFSEVWYTFNSGMTEEVEITFLALTPGSQFFIDVWQSCEGQVDSLAVLDNCILVDSDMPAVTDTLGVLQLNTDYILRVSTRLTSDLPGEFLMQLFDPNTSSNNNFFNENQFSISPNPATDELTIDFELLDAKESNIEIFSVDGKRVKNLNLGKLNVGNQKLNLTISDLDQGLYIGKFKFPDGEYSFKFVKN